MAKELDEIIYEAIKANETLQSLTGGRVYSICVEVPPDKDDNTPLPYIIITDDSLQNEPGTKDSIWESSEDHVQASVLISAKGPSQVKRIRRLVRKAVSDYAISGAAGNTYLTSLTNDGIAWDWQKPCYYDSLHYQCDMDVDLTDEEDNEHKEDTDTNV